jgi:signal transduction histidine kinase
MCDPEKYASARRVSASVRARAVRRYRPNRPYDDGICRSGSQPSGWKQAGFKLKLSGDPADLQSVSEQKVVVPLLTVLPLTAYLGVRRLKLFRFERTDSSTAETVFTVRSSVPSSAPSVLAETASSECSQTALCHRPTCPRCGLSVGEPAKTTTKLRVLLVEDNPADVELELLTLRKDGFEISGDVAQTAEEFTERVRTTSYDLILADYNLPQWRGTEALEILCRENLDVPLIVVTGYLGEEKAVDYIKQGASDCVLKDRLARLPASVRRAQKEKQLRDQRRQAQEELAQKVAELARSNAELEQFAYVASHDLQEPLRMIANYTQLLAERYRGKLDEQADKYIAYSVDGALRMQALIQDLLKFSRVGRAEIEPRTTDCRTVVEHALTNLQAAVLESRATVKWDSLPVVMADPSQLTQVFQNLIANAIKFHGPKPPVIQIAAEKKDHEWVFTLSDNGIGIAAENWLDIFVIFRRLHTRDEYAGNGIGLSICKKIIERHGGQIWIEAQASPGCSFKFTLPMETLLKAPQETRA